MKEALEIRTKAALVALAALVEAQDTDVPWHYGIQTKRLRRDLDALADALEHDPANAVRLDPEILEATGEEVVIPWDPGQVEDLIFDRHGKIVAALSGLVARLRYGPIAKPEIASAAAELAPLIADLNAEGFALEPGWHREIRETGEDVLGPPWGRHQKDAADDWPQGDNPTHDDLDLGRRH
jgi:hypothetical protein